MENNIMLIFHVFVLKVTGKHTHMTNIHHLRIREFVHLLKARLMEDPTMTPKVVYEEELEKLKHTDNGAILIDHMPAYASIRTSLYNMKNKYVELVLFYGIAWLP